MVLLRTRAQDAKTRRRVTGGLVVIASAALNARRSAAGCASGVVGAGASWLVLGRK
jgi:hypothetical protein